MIKQVICICALVICSCKTKPNTESTVTQTNNIDIANKFIDAFYSFNIDSLESILSQAKQSQPNILYYQKWAECGHYKIVNRNNYIVSNDSLVLFPVTVKDDLMEALNINFNVTDTFRISIRNTKIISVQTSSNDPDIYYHAKEWVKKNRPQLVEKACEGIWQGGPTPCECVQGMVKGFIEFSSKEK